MDASHDYSLLVTFSGFLAVLIAVTEARRCRKHRAEVDADFHSLRVVMGEKLRWIRRKQDTQDAVVRRMADKIDDVLDAAPHPIGESSGLRIHEEGNRGA